MLATLYVQGLGVRQDFTEAVRLTRLAAQQGLGVAQSDLAFAYANGVGRIPQDFVEAYKWYSLAVANSRGDFRELALEGQNFIEQTLSKEQLAEAIKICDELFNETDFPTRGGSFELPQVGQA